MTLLSHLPCHCVAWSVQRQCQTPSLSTTHHITHTLSLKLLLAPTCVFRRSYQLRLSLFLHNCFPTVKSFNLQGTTTAVLCATLSLATAFPRSSPTTGFEQVQSQSEYVCVVCMCAVTTAFPLPRLSTWKVQRQFQLVEWVWAGVSFVISNCFPTSNFKLNRYNDSPVFATAFPHPT